MNAATPTLPRSEGHRPPSQVSLVMVVLLRLLSLYLVGEISGGLHIALDATAEFTHVDPPHEDCGDGEHHDCPPGCISCHCTHVALERGERSLPCVEVQAALVPTPSRVASAVPSQALPPKNPDSTPLYRPPRA